jgi:hypothetical protein
VLNILLLKLQKKTNMFSLTISLLRKLSQNKIHRILIDFFRFLNIQLFTIYNFYLIGLCIPIFSFNNKSMYDTRYIP